VLAIIVPALLLQISPRDHTAALALLATLSGIAYAATPTFVGVFSDRARRRGDDRRRQTAVVLAIDVVALVAMAFAGTTNALAVALVAATVTLSAAQTIYQALLPEVVPRSAWGMAAGVRGAMTLVGTVLGLGCAALLAPRLALFAAAAIVVVAAATLALIPKAAASAPDVPHAVVRDRHDLGVTLVARGWIVLGMTLLNTYVLFFFSDVIGVRDASLRTGLVAGAALLGAIASSIVAGTLSDRADRRVVVALAGVPMTLAALGFAIFPDVRALFAYAALFGLGYGAVFAVGWALALDAVPEIGDAARDLGVWGTLSNVPAIVAPALGAWIIAHGTTPAIGYRWLFAVAGACFAIGSLIVLRVGRAPLYSPVHIGLLSITTLVRTPVITARIRVRQWGRLPMRREPIVLIANHQHEDESEIIVERTFVQARLRPPFTASTRRMYEPGFFAVRLPWLAPVMRNVNAGALFRGLGMLPLENELSVQPLRKLARAVTLRHGAVAVDAVFRGAALDVVPAGARTTRDLLASRYFLAGEARVRIAHLHEPYRGEAMAALRAGVDADVARIVGVVRRGAGFFVTPEGFYSTDGRMRPLKGIVDHLLPVAQPWLAAIAFDPFRGRRLPLLYRIVPPADPRRLAVSLAAARPVTTSALLARVMPASGEPFTRDDALARVTAQLDALPANAFVDPELARDPARCVDEALHVLTARGTLAHDDGRYRLTQNRKDARFHDVTDMVAYQATFIEETLTACASLPSP